MPAASFESVAAQAGKAAVRFNRARLALLLLVGAGTISATAAGYPNAEGRSDATGLIAFHADPNGADDLFVIGADGKRLRRLTRNLEEIATPAWSPSGKLLAFLARPSGQAHVYVIRRDGRDLKRLTAESGDHYAISWSPDGRQLAYVCCGESEESIYLVGPDGTDRRVLVRDAGQPAWSPDGKTLAFLRVRGGNPDIYTIRVDGSNERRLTTDRAEDVDPAWSADGKLIAFDSKRTGRSQIFVMDADGSNQRRLTHDRFNDQQPRWSPDGTRIVFTSFRNQDPNLRGIGNAEIVTVTLKGRVRNLTHTRYWEGDPAWSPDSKNLAFAQRRDPGPRGTFAIGVMSATGLQRRLLPRIYGFSHSLANSCCPVWHR